MGKNIKKAACNLGLDFNLVCIILTLNQPTYLAKYLLCSKPQKLIINFNFFIFKGGIYSS